MAPKYIGGKTQTAEPPAQHQEGRARLPPRAVEDRTRPAPMKACLACSLLRTRALGTGTVSALPLTSPSGHPHGLAGAHGHRLHRNPPGAWWSPHITGCVWEEKGPSSKDFGGMWTDREATGHWLTHGPSARQEERPLAD